MVQAVKEFSKSRLRKRAQSNLLRRPAASKRMRALPAGIGFNSPLHRHSVTEENNNAFELIKEEIAIMKKLHHPNLVTLIEVLDDPEEDSLYMVMEMCKKGVVMQVGLEERADPYSEEQCRCWFRDMILGLEYRTSGIVCHGHSRGVYCHDLHDCYMDPVYHQDPIRPVDQFQRSHPPVREVAYSADLEISSCLAHVNLQMLADLQAVQVAEACESRDAAKHRLHSFFSSSPVVAILSVMISRVDLDP